MANITSLRTSARQTTLNAVVEFSFADIVGARSGDTIELCGIPKNAIVTGVSLEIVDAFVNGAAVDLTIAIGDGTVTYIAATDADAGTDAVSTAVPVAYTVAKTMSATLGGTTAGDYTAGSAFIIVEYIQKGRSNEVHE